MLTKNLTLLICILMFFPATLHAQEKDSVIETIEKALVEYKNNDFSNAATSLDYAGQLIRQKKGEALSKLLPGPLTGWTADAGNSKVSSASFLGGGLTVEKTYSKDDSLVKIAILTDSPLMQSMILVFSNPLFAASAGQLELINGHKGVVNYQNNGGDINIVVNNRFLVTLKGNNVSREDLMSYAKSIDLNTIGALP